MIGEPREIRQTGHMSDTEALMWAAERDPWLTSSMGSVFVLDTTPDIDRLRRQIDDASKTFLRLRERVDEGLHLTTPRWVPDTDFDIERHVTAATLPAPGGLGELFELAAEVLSTPFDRDRPLWHFVVVSGSDDDESIGGAMIMQLHHSLSDGIGAVRLAEMYLDVERDPEHRSSEAESEDESELEDEPEPAPSGGQAVLDDVGHVLRRQLGLARRVVGEVALWGVDRGRARRVVKDLGASARTVVGQLGSSEEEAKGGSPLWRTRSGERHLEVLDLDLDEVRAAAKARGGTVNDLFVAGSVMASAAYHARRGAEVERFNLSFILSTRTDHAAGGNSWAPVPLSIDASVRSAAETFADVRGRLASSRDEAQRGAGELMELAAGLASSLPAAVISRAGRARASRLDFATSNLRAAPFTLYVAGARITHMYPVGPLAGTAWNLTAMSYDGNLHLGLFVDPVAVESPAELRNDLEAAYGELLARPDSPS